MTFKRSILSIRGIVLILILLFLVPAGFFKNIANQLYSQHKALYLMNEVPNSLELNPAIQFDCQTFVQLPLISGAGFYYRNNGFSFNQAFNTNTGINADSLQLDLDGLSEALGPRNHIREGAALKLLGFGFSYENWFFSAGISNRSSSRISFNRDVVNARDGNWDLSSNTPRDIRIDGTGLHLINFTEVALRASRELFPGFSAGIAVKYLAGSAYLQTRRSNIALITRESPLEVMAVSNLLVRSSFPLDVQFNDQGYISNVTSGIQSLSDLPPLLFSWNHGFAMDAGVVFSYSEKLSFSASIIDIGFIRWRKNINVLSQDEEFMFEGVDLDNILQQDQDSDLLQALSDSIQSSFRLQESSDAYIAFIPARVFASTRYQLNSRLTLGAVIEGEFLSRRFYPSVSFQAIARPTEWLTASLNYSLMDRSFSTLGFSLVAGTGPLQFFLVSDHIPLSYVRESQSGLLIPYRSRTLNFQLGFNLLFNCEADRKAQSRRLRWNKSCPAYR